MSATTYERLKRFVGKCLPENMEDWGDIDGFQLEEICLECGILERVERTEFCGDECACAGYYGSDEFPIQCNRLTPLGLACRNAVRGGCSIPTDQKLTRTDEPSVENKELS